MTGREHDPTASAERSLSALSPKMRSAVHQLGVDSTTAEVVGALDANDIRSLLIKGPAIARWLYGDTDIESRAYVDVDLLVSPSDQAEASAVLEQLGFTREWKTEFTAGEISQLFTDDVIVHAIPWVRSPGPNVDLHRTIPGVRVESAELWRAFASGTGSMEVGGRTVEVPGEPARALIVALQAAKWEFDQPKVSADLRRALALLPESVWRDAARLAERLDALSAFSTGLLVLPDGEALAKRLGLATELDVEAVLHRLSAHPIALSFETLAEKPGISAKAAFVARRLVPTRPLLRYRFPIARRGPLGLAVAYLWWPLLLLRHVGPGFLAWRRARRDAA